MTIKLWTMQIHKGITCNSSKQTKAFAQQVYFYSSPPGKQASYFIKPFLFPDIGKICFNTTASNITIKHSFYNNHSYVKPKRKTISIFQHSFHGKNTLPSMLGTCSVRHPQNLESFKY